MRDRKALTHAVRVAAIRRLEVSQTEIQAIAAERDAQDSREAQSQAEDQLTQAVHHWTAALAEPAFDPERLAGLGDTLTSRDRQLRSAAAKSESAAAISLACRREWATSRSLAEQATGVENGLQRRLRRHHEETALNRVEDLTAYRSVKK